MRQRLGALLFVLALGFGLPIGTGLVLSACHPTPNIVTPQGQQAYRADQVVLRVNELQNAVIQAEAQKGGLETATAYRIVQFTVGANQVLKTTPQGWQNSLRQAWTSTKTQLPPITNPAVSAAIAAFEAVLAAL